MYPQRTLPPFFVGGALVKVVVADWWVISAHDSPFAAAMAARAMSYAFL
jgi:hypothetical protein